MNRSDDNDFAADISELSAKISHLLVDSPGPYELKTVVYALALNAADCLYQMEHPVKAYTEFAGATRGFLDKFIAAKPGLRITYDERKSKQ